MKKFLLTFLIILFSYILGSNVYAGAAEKWEYEPIQKDMNIKVKAYKVDQYGDAINDKKYEIKIDPKTTANKKLMGGVGIAKLLKKANWASVGVSAIEYLLEGIDWVIDPEAQSIWRNKRDQNNSYSCEYRNSAGQIVLFSLGGTEPARCPLVAVENWAEYWGNEAKFSKWLSPIDPNGSTKFEHTYKNWAGQTLTDVRDIQASPDPDQSPSSPPQKEYLTAEALADYMLGTHPDFKDSKYTSKLPEPLTWTDVENVWKPHNQWEAENSPTVKEVERQLEQATPISEDSEVITKPDPETGLNNFTLPAFCSWATPVCTAITDLKKWANDESDSDTELDIPDQEQPDIDTDIAFGGMCPDDRQAEINMGVGVIKMPISYEPICTTVSTAKPVLIFVGFFVAALIIGGVKTE
ncbi:MULTISPECIES: virulence factor TspB C-terminal domain-related protein [Acinetobacter]|uniref:Uncharacterized protein n=1 Tax=Acinetobacter radioresistens SK82 TaxID=596318 RepID=A0ABM9YJS2_ACIRA|nr:MULTISPECIES: virulence factor TspB C-terminal domain-related protein [Acinetobacter]EET81154.1 hypothetical protein ACIRA0001_0177 [Acinetobacter radioresistens SK82]EXC27343.1 hypothetical protein J520_2844 [Acinetobacter sp. 869535]EXE54124.1 hypothetical protein J579_3212 [Acinetobacter sp. 1239920]PKH29161.1 hypothetical protein BJF94_12000 [Acinetobacter radioresistens]QMU05326.1 hypothetical protein FOC39_15290 [Acinetobacter radioresistens]